MKLALYVTTSRGAAVLRAAVASGVEVAYVVTARDPGMLDDGYDEIARLATEAGIHGYESAPPEIKVTHALAAGWRRILHNVPNLIVLHDSLLPRYRGFAPLVTALINGEDEVGVSAVLATEQADRGEIVAQQAVDVTYPARIADVIASVEPLYADIADAVISDWPAEGWPQREQSATYSVWRDERDYRIDWTRPADWIRRFIDATGHPYKGALTLLENGAARRVLAAEETDDVHVEDRHPGKTLFLDERGPVVICGQGMLRLTDIRDSTGEPWRPSSVRTRFA